MRHPSSLDFDVKDRHEVNLGTTVVTGSPLQALAHPEHTRPGTPPPRTPQRSPTTASQPPLHTTKAPIFQTLSQKPP